MNRTSRLVSYAGSFHFAFLSTITRVIVTRQLWEPRWNAGSGDETAQNVPIAFFPLLCTLYFVAPQYLLSRVTYVTLKSTFTTHRSNDLRFQHNLSLSSQQWRGLDNVKDDRCYLRLFLTKPGARKPRSNNTY